MSSRTALLLIVLPLFIFCGCKSKSPEPQNKGQADRLLLEFDLPKIEFTEGEAVCVRIVAHNFTADTISLVDFPASKIWLVDQNGNQLPRIQRADFVKPSKMWLPPGDSSSSEIELTGFFENSGPAMLSPGRYKFGAIVRYFSGKEVRLRQKGFKIPDSVMFVVMPPTGDSKNALEDFRKAIEPLGGLQSFVGKKEIIVTDAVKSKLNKIIEKYPETPIARSLLIDNLGIWYRDLPIEKYSKFFEKVPPECPCCLHKFAIDRLVARYVRENEREKILNIVEDGLNRFPNGTPVGDYLRNSFEFRIENGHLVR